LLGRLPATQQRGDAASLIGGEWRRLVDNALDVFLGAGCAEVSLCCEKVWVGWLTVAA
jgi:hypothetical protein